MHIAEYFISKLGLEKHIEGGYFKEIYSNPYSINDEKLPVQFEEDRALSTTIYYLLKSGQVSKFHKLKFDEIWFYHYGSPMKIYMIDTNGELIAAKLGLNIENGELPQVLIPAGMTFGAEVIEDNLFSLVSCMVSPGFDYRDFQIYKADDLIKQFPKHQELIMKLNG